MIGSAIDWAKDYVDSILQRRFRAYLREEMPRLLPLTTHYQEFLESDPSLRQSRFDHTLRPSKALTIFADLRDRLVASGVSVTDTTVDLDDFAAWLKEFSGLERFYRTFGDMHIEKCLEHYLVYRELRLTKEDVYIDIASAKSRWAPILRRQGMKAYRLDLIHKKGIHGMDIGANVVETGLPDGFASALSTQCAFELFFGDTDKKFIKEADRILNDHGRCAILPLYLDDAYFVLHSPYTLPPVSDIDDDAIRIWRDDTFQASYTRHYSPEAFARHVLSVVPPTLSARVVSINNLGELMERYPGERIYCSFMLVLERKAVQPVKKATPMATAETRTRPVGHQLRTEQPIAAKHPWK